MRFGSSAPNDKSVRLMVIGSLVLVLSAGVQFIWRQEFTGQLVAGGLRILGTALYTLSTTLWLGRQGSRSIAFRIFLWLLLLAVAGFQIMSLWFGWMAQLSPPS
jgi:hypothetical protein